MNRQGLIEQPRFGDPTPPAPPQFASTFRSPVYDEWHPGQPYSLRDLATFIDETAVGHRVHSVPRVVVPRSRVPGSEGSPGRPSIPIGSDGGV